MRRIVLRTLFKSVCTLPFHALLLYQLDSLRTFGVYHVDAVALLDSLQAVFFEYAVKLVHNLFVGGRAGCQTVQGHGKGFDT
nr:MAG: hypothetical protein [Bacteriophage sp.]